MQELLLNVNWLAVGVGTVVSFLLGWAWYSPRLFGNLWAVGVGIDLSQGEKPPAMAMVTQLIGTFLLAWLVAVAEAANSLAALFLTLLAFVFLSLSQGLFVKKSAVSMAVEQGYIVTMAVIMVLLQRLL